MYVRGIRSLSCVPGYVISMLSMYGELVQANLRRDRRYQPGCPACGATMDRTRVELPTARDLPLATALRVLLVYEAIQGRFRACGGSATICPPGIEPNARATRRLMGFVSRLARSLPLPRFEEAVAVADDAFRWDQAILHERLKRLTRQASTPTIITVVENAASTMYGTPCSSSAPHSGKVMKPGISVTDPTPDAMAAPSQPLSLPSNRIMTSRGNTG